MKNLIGKSVRFIRESQNRPITYEGTVEDVKGHMIKIRECVMESSGKLDLGTVWFNTNASSFAYIREL